MNRLRQDLLFALRAFGKAPGFTALAVLVLAVGIGANTATFTVVNELLLRPRAGRVDQLVGVYSRDRTRPDSYRLMSYPNYADLRERREVFGALAAQTFAMVAISGETSGKPRALASVVSSNYFETLGTPLAAGRSFRADEERPGAGSRVAIASYGRWFRSGLDPAIVGRHLTVNGADYEVVGVAPRGTSGTMALLSPDIYLPLGVFDAVVSDRFRNNGHGLGDPANEGLTVFGALAPGQSRASATSALDVIARQMETARPDVNRNQELSVYPLSRFSAGPVPQTNTAIASVSALLLTLSALVLVIACLNIANMLLARGAARRKELAVRLAMGAGRGRIVRQLLTEGVVLATSAAALGVVLSYWAMDALTAWLSGALPFDLDIRTTPDPAVMTAALLLAVIATIAFGLGPALTLSRRDLVADLKDRGDDRGHGRGLLSTRSLLVVGEIALSLALLTAGGVFTRPVIAAARMTPGFSYDQLLFASVDTQLGGMNESRGREAYTTLASRLRAMPGVTSATLASTVPFGDNIDSGRFEAVGAPGGAPARARALRVIGADYFRTLGLPMLRGREFTSAEETSADAPSVAIVDETFARQLFGHADPIGQLIRPARTAGEAPSTAAPLEIVGVAPPLAEELLDRAPAPHVYVPFGRTFRSAMHLHLRIAAGIDSDAALDSVRREISAVDPRWPVLALSTFRTFHDRSLELLAVRGAAAIFAGLGALALLLSVVGVYGVRSYLVAQRTREIGIRMALGAAAGDVVRLMLRDGLRLTSAGVAIGLPLAVVTSLAFRSVFVDIGGFDALVIGAASVVLGGASLAASAIPARRAALVEPLTALRE